MNQEQEYLDEINELFKNFMKDYRSTSSTILYIQKNLSPASIKSKMDSAIKKMDYQWKKYEKEWKALAHIGYPKTNKSKEKKDLDKKKEEINDVYHYYVCRDNIYKEAKKRTETKKNEDIEAYERQKDYAKSLSSNGEENSRMNFYEMAKVLFTTKAGGTKYNATLEEIKFDLDKLDDNDKLSDNYLKKFYYSAAHYLKDIFIPDDDYSGLYKLDFKYYEAIRSQLGDKAGVIIKLLDLKNFRENMHSYIENQFKMNKNDLKMNAVRLWHIKMLISDMQFYTYKYNEYYDANIILLEQGILYKPNDNVKNIDDNYEKALWEYFKQSKQSKQSMDNLPAFAPVLRF